MTSSAIIDIDWLESGRERSLPPRLQPVIAPRHRRRPRFAHALVAAIGVMLIAGAQMGLSVMTTQSTFELASAGTQQDALNWQKQILNEKLVGLDSPQYLAANATALGMVPSGQPNYLTLSNGTVQGAQQPASATAPLDALGRPLVANQLIAHRPLATDPSMTLSGPVAPPVAPSAAAASTSDSTTPPLLNGALPAVSTH